MRVYALETGGMGTYDMQSGINPVTQAGQADLLRARLRPAPARQLGRRLVKHGEDFVRRLLAMAAAPGTPAERVAELKAKAVILRKMMRAARTVPNEWSAHQRFANTPPGLGIHAINLDSDLGPWLQVLKLKALKDDAIDAGRAKLTGAEIELMNLAGPRTGLEMMTPVGARMPTSNFFSEGGYARNPVVRDKTGARAAGRPGGAHGSAPEEAGLHRVRADLRRGRAPLSPGRAHAAWRPSCRSSSPASIRPCRIRATSAASILTSGGRTCARGSRPSSTSASFMRLCMSTNGSA